MSDPTQTQTSTPPRRLRLPNLRGKVTLLLLLLSLGPMVVAGFVNVNRAVQQGKRSVRARHAQAVLMTAAAVGAMLDRARDDLRAVARRVPPRALARTLAQRLAASGTGRVEAPPGHDDLRDLARLNEHYSAAFVALPSGRVVWTAPHHNLEPPPSLASVPGFSGAVTGVTLMGVLPPLSGASRPRPLRLEPLRAGPDRAVVGWVGVVLDPAALSDVLLRARGPGGQPSPTLSVVDADDRVVAHSRPGLVGRAAPSYVPQLRASGLATAEIEHRGAPHVVARASVRNAGWHVVLAVPGESAYREVSVLIWILTAVLGLTLVFVLLFADDMANRLLAPIRALEEGARILGGGALDYRLELAEHRKDELGRLASAFNQMGDNLLAHRDELRAYGRSLETANAELDALVYGITHDLKKSLRSIDAFATFLEEDHGEQLGEDGLDLVHGIEGKVERINDLADDLIALVQQERERGEASRFPLAGLVDEVVARVQAKRPGLVTVQAPLPELHADRAQIGLALEQLIENGLTFNRDPNPSVTIRAVDEGLDWRIELEDNGIGIEPRYHQTVFELFARLNQPDEFPGSGTGLSIARRVVEEHRGRLQIHSQLGEGTRVTLHLPKEPMLLTRPGMRLDDLS